MLYELVYTYTDAERLDKEKAIVPERTALETLGGEILVVQEKMAGRRSAPEPGEA